MESKPQHDENAMSKQAKRIPLHQAQQIATGIVEQLQPYCHRIEIAGSIRRECATIGDIEIVCIPKNQEVPDGFFSTSFVRHREFVRWVEALEYVRGLPTGKYTQRVLPGGVVLDLFMTGVDNWGYIYAIRTGSARFSREVLAKGWVTAGFHGKNGRLHRERTGFMPIIRTEHELFDLIGLDYIEPRLRT